MYVIGLHDTYTKIQHTASRKREYITIYKVIDVSSFNIGIPCGQFSIKSFFHSISKPFISLSLFFILL